MALPTTGPISLGLVRTELKRSDRISLGDTDVRSLASKASGMISLSDLRGKSAGSPPIFLNHTVDRAGTTVIVSFNMAGAPVTSFTSTRGVVHKYSNTRYQVIWNQSTGTPIPSITVTAKSASGSATYTT